MIRRDPASAERARHDLIVVGGGIYGAMLALEASARGLRPLLLERDDFGGATSWNSLRIVHGGLRYLQKLDLHRFRESVAERRWYLRELPDLVRPLPCLMPLYGTGLHRPAVLRAALRLNDLLAWRRNAGVRTDRTLPSGAVLSPDETARRFPAVERSGLRGAALWHDAVMLNSQRVLIEVLRWAAARGAVLLNYVEAVGLLTDGGRVTGVRAVDRRTGEERTFRSPVVVNAAGPWAGAVARLAGPERPELFRPSLAFNAILDREPIADLATAVAPRRPGGRIYFLYPWNGRMLAGTYHAPWTDPVGPPTAPVALVDDFLADLNAAVPSLHLTRRDVVRVLAGLLPAARAGSADLAVRETILDHGATGLSGLFSVSGVKYTTARLVAQKTVALAFPEARPTAAQIGRPEPVPIRDAEGMERWAEADRPGALAYVRRLIAEESVLQPDDLLLRRTDWSMDPASGERLAGLVAEAAAPAGGWREPILA